MLVALTILAIALIAITQTAFSFRKNAVYLQQKTIALWVAQNIYTEYALGIRQIPSTLIDEEGKQMQLSHEWNWSVKFKPVENKPIIKTDIYVHPSQSNITAAHLTGYLGTKES